MKLLILIIGTQKIYQVSNSYNIYNLLLFLFLDLGEMGKDKLIQEIRKNWRNMQKKWKKSKKLIRIWKKRIKNLKIKERR